jgi:hypothetical protein
MLHAPLFLVGGIIGFAVAAIVGLMVFLVLRRRKNKKTA